MANQETPATKSTFKAALRLRQERERHGWSQKEMAEMIETNQVTVSRWEKGVSFPGPYFRQRLVELFGKSLEELGLFTEVKDESAEDSNMNDGVTAALPSAAHMPLWNVPYRRNPFFTGREEILASLYTMLNDNKAAALTQAQAISGLGGIGKTQVAVEYAYRYCDDYQAILWIDASSRETLVADIITLAALLDLPEQNEQDQHVVVMAAKRWLSTHKDWLLILDNVDDLEMINDFLPTRGTGDILITTRLQALGTIAQSIEVEKMGLEEGIMFLLRRTKVLRSGASLSLEHEQRTQAAEIVSELDGLPLALDQAAAYIEETKYGFSSYLNLYRTRRQALLLRRGMLPVDHPESVTATWSLSFQRIEHESHAAADLLRLLAFFSAEAIPEEIITIGAIELGPSLGPAVRNEMEMNEAIELLLQYSLLRRNPEEKLLSIHRLVQAVLRDNMDGTQQQLWAERTVRIINRAFPDVALENWTQCQRYIAHAQISTTYIKTYQLFFPEAARLLNQAANYLSTYPDYEQAESLLEQALVIRQRVLEQDHPDTASTLNDLGVVYHAQGKYQQAELLLQQALAIREKKLELKHPDTATSLNNLALLHYSQGKYASAEQLYKQALDIQQKELPSDHPDIAKSRSNLAELFVVQGKYPEAESLYQQALSRQETVLGPYHPDVAKTLNNLALLYRSKGEYERAEQLYKQAFSIQERILRPSHPDLAQTIHNTARLYRAQGDYAKAEPLYLQALAIRKEVFGPSHPQVAQSWLGLAKLYNSQGKYPQAEEFGRQALGIQEQWLGANHPDLAYTLATLAKSYQGQQRFDEATKSNERALAIRRETSDAEHPHVAFIENNQAEIYLAQRRDDEAEPLIARSLAIRRKKLGPKHPYMGYSLSNQAEHFFLRGDYIQAENLFKQALEISEQNLGPEHPRTASTYHNLGRLYFTLGRYQEAEEFYEKALTIRERALGEEHPATITSLEHYATLLRETRREELACEFEARVRIIRVKHIKPPNEQTSCS